MRDNVDILEKYIENLVVKKNLLQTTVEAYKLDINEYLKFLKERNIDILDEPTTGLHIDDIKKLIEVLNTLVEQGNTVVGSSKI